MRRFTGSSRVLLMAVRKVVNARQMTAARLLVGGESFYRALIHVGYSRWTARNPSALLRSSWGLREAIRREQEAQQHYFRPAPTRRRRYDRRPVASAVRMYAGPEDRDSVSNTWLHKLHAEGKRAQAIAEGRPMLPKQCSRCRGPLEGRDHWCPNCRCAETV
jgi:hypothetical protein